jgi:hypothetical protein
MSKRDMGVPVEQLSNMPVKVPKNTRVDKMQDAVVDGKMVVPVGGKIIIGRTTWKKGVCTPTLSICTVTKLEADGTVYTFDETRQQVFMFNAGASDLPVVKIWHKEREKSS